MPPSKSFPCNVKKEQFQNLAVINLGVAESFNTMWSPNYFLFFPGIQLTYILHLGWVMDSDLHMISLSTHWLAGTEDSPCGSRGPEDSEVLGCDTAIVERSLDSWVTIWRKPSWRATWSGTYALGFFVREKPNTEIWGCLVQKLVILVLFNPLRMCLFLNTLLLPERMGYSDWLSLGHAPIFGALS